MSNNYIKIGWKSGEAILWPNTYTPTHSVKPLFVRFVSLQRIVCILFHGLGPRREKSLGHVKCPVVPEWAGEVVGLYQNLAMRVCVVKPETAIPTYQFPPSHVHLHVCPDFICITFWFSCVTLIMLQYHIILGYTYQHVIVAFKVFVVDHEL